jgi:endonuclease YncB( thermonuclease family)
MAGTRRKTQRRGGGRKKRASGIGGSTLIWGAALVAIVGGISAYDNSSAVRRFANGLMPGNEEKVATKSQPRSEERKSAQSRPTTPVPPRDVAAARSGEMKRGPAPQRHDALKTAAIRPPAPIGRPDPSNRPVPAAVKPDMPSVQSGRAKFYLCGTAKQDDCVVSADSFMLQGQKIRIAGIEVPNIKKPRCEAERIKASDAKLRIRAFLDSGPFDVHAANANDQDSSGQKIRAVTRNGISLSDILVREGLARRPGASGGWC